MKILKFRSANTLFFAQNISYLSLEILCICYVTLHSVRILVMHVSPFIKLKYERKNDCQIFNDDHVAKAVRLKTCFLGPITILTSTKNASVNFDTSYCQD